MSSFTALNVYPDSDSEAEVDNTQEIQIEEALKLYQKALKLHHDGEWAEAHKAYDELFKSSIFLADADEELQVHGRNTAAASSLPLVFYLAYTNYGAFKLEHLKGEKLLKPESIKLVVQQALDWFATALGRDAGDPSLWRKAAHLALIIDSPRVTRFCLESILDHETVGADSAHDILALLSGGHSNPEECFASLQLCDLLQKIVDTIALSDPQFQKPVKKKINPVFTKHLNPYPWLPLPSPGETKPLSAVLESITERKQVLEINARSWPAIGKAILSRLSTSSSIEGDPNASSVIQIIIPTFEGEEESRDTTPDQSTPEIKSETAIADDGEDVSMTDAATTDPPPEAASTTPSGRRGSGNRKRKSTSIGVDPAVDAGRSRLSKRQRDKKEADAAAAAAAAAPESKKSKVRLETQDEKLFNTAEECFGPLGISFGTASSLKIKSTTTSSASSQNGNGNGNNGDGTETDSDKEDTYLQDFKKILQDWDDDKGNVIIYGDGIQPPDEAAQGMAFLDLETNIPNRPILAGDEGLRRWVRGVNLRGLNPEQAGFEWIRALCLRDIPLPKSAKSKPPLAANGVSSWIRHTWPEPLRDLVAAMARECEDVLWKYFKLFEETLGKRIQEKGWSSFTEADYAIIEWAETMLEIYLSDLSSQERSRTGVESTAESEEKMTLKRECVQRWSYLLGDLMNCRPRNEENQLVEDQLTLRYLWASAVFTGYTDASREFRLDCFESLRVLLEEGRHPIIELPNCPVMSEISSARAAREISKLKTVDFFTTVFKATNELGTVGSKTEIQQQASEVIEFLEAVLEPDAILPYDEEEGRILGEIGRFLEGSSAMFRLHLWEKLKTAYEKVSDPPKILSCMIRSLEVVITDLRSKSYIDASEDHRHFVLLRALRLTEDMLGNILNLMLFESEKIVQGLEFSSLLSGMKAMTGVLRMLHVYAFWEDTVVNTEVKASDLHSYRLVVVKFRWMVVKGWLVMYLLYREALRRGMGAPGERDWEKGEKEMRLAGLLKDLHDELGVRSYCKLSNHLFLKVMFEELMRFNLRQFDNELLQCIHCRFHITISQNDSFSLYEHKTDAEPLDRVSAAKLIDFLLLLASRKKIMQLQKSDVKTALDKIVEVIGFPRKAGNYRIQYNDAVIDQYLKSSIHPLKLFDALKGRESISTSMVGGEYAMIAAKGLYFIQGKIALFPIKYHPKKVGAVKQEEVEAAIRFLKADLVCMPDRWEGWYRLGQSYEFQMEDGMTWNAEGMNVKRGELMALERKSILCYMLAVSLALQHADRDDPEVRKTIANLYTDFGYRMYSAARPPVSMDSFCLEGFERHYSGRQGQGMYKAKAHTELRYETAIKAAKVLFERSLNISEEVNWKNYYMVGKCMGKLFNEYRKENDDSMLYQPEDVLEMYILAVKHCPEKAGNDHIFEPHHKLVSTTCKFVQQDLLEPKRACEILEATHFTKRVENVDDRDSFVKYVLDVLKKMKSADKPKWHHRMTYRAARLKYEEMKDVAGARAELSSLFSNKAAQLSIWRPENERPGRHFVFAFEYTTFYIDMLEQLEDRTTLDILAKRVRKGANQFFKHTEVWTHLFVAYIKVLRRTGKVPEQFDEEVFKNVSYDEFNTYSQRLDEYCNLKETSSPTHDLLQEVFELRRLNAGLAKTPLIDELLADTYVKLYSELVPEILKRLTQENEDRANPMSLKNVLFDEQATDPAASNAVALAAQHSKLDDLPIRGKMTKVTRRELVSKASALCKVAAPKGSNSPKQKPTSAGTSASATRGASVASGDDTPMGSPGQGARDDESDDDVPDDIDLSALPGITIESRGSGEGVF